MSKLAKYSLIVLVTICIFGGSLLLGNPKNLKVKNFCVKSSEWALLHNFFLYELSKENIKLKPSYNGQDILFFLTRFNFHQFVIYPILTSVLGQREMILGGLKFVNLKTQEVLALYVVNPSGLTLQALRNKRIYPE
ncbi:MAG: hypothetical protein GXO69_07090, partial [Acidobacteria bacterium]|nr:hypothetical protein [Acidobacteriota bacterium]